MPHRPYRIGLTGGIGSGKSTVARVMADQGAALIDADALSRQLTEPGGDAIAPIAAKFGTDAIAPGGAMDRAFMRELVFKDPSARQLLEAIIHPLVGRRIAGLSQKAAQAGAACIVFDIPLLVESARWRPALDLIVVVDCLPATQVTRVMRRSGWSREAVEAVISNQATRGQRLAAADISLYNEGLPLDALEQSVRRWAARFGL